MIMFHKDSFRVHLYISHYSPNDLDGRIAFLSFYQILLQLIISLR